MFEQSRHGQALMAVFLALLFITCSGDEAAEIICKPNYGVPCTCDDGLEGEKICSPQGTDFINECQCEAPPEDCETVGCPKVQNGRVQCVDNTCVVACDEGFAGGATDCFDLNECSTSNGGCETTCTNNEGSFECSCDEDYYLEEDGFSCEKINPCGTDNGGCHDLASCKFIYKDDEVECSCSPGYQGDGIDCSDIDECTNGLQACDPDATCTNTAGSFECACVEGYEGDGSSCDDIDECATDNGGCAGTCLNLAGSYECACDPGFATGTDGATCDDIDECAEENGGCSQICINEAGSYICGCNPSFILTLDGTSCLSLFVETNGLTWSRHVIRDRYCVMGTDAPMDATALDWNAGWCALGESELPDANWRHPTRSKLESIITLYDGIDSFMAEHAFVDNTEEGVAISIWTQSPGSAPETFWVLDLKTGVFSEADATNYGEHWFWAVHDD